MNVLDDPVITLPIFMEAWMQGFLQMAIITQAVMYYYNPLGDKMSQRLYVGALVALAATQTGLAVFKAIHVIILRQPWSQWPGYFLDVFLNGLICSFSEVWLIRRCWKSTRKNKWVLLGLGSIGFSTCVVNIYLGADLAISRVRGGVVSDPLRSDRSPATVFAFDYFIFASFVLDLSMSVILGWNLFKARVGVKYLDQTLMRINLMIWESAVLPWLSMLVAVGLYHARVQNLRNLVLLFLLLTGKLYILGILLALNSRESYRKDMGENQPHGRTSLSGYQWDEEKTLGGSANSSREPRPKNGEVSIHDVLRTGPGAVSETISVASFLPEAAPSLVKQPSSIKSIKRKPLPPLPKDKDEDFAPVNNFGFANMGSQDLSITDALRLGPGPDTRDSRKASTQVDPLDWPLSSFVRDERRANSGTPAPVIVKQASEPRGFLPPVELGARSLSIDSGSFNMEPCTTCTSAEITVSGMLYARRGRRDAVSGDSIGDLCNAGN